MAVVAPSNPDAAELRLELEKLTMLGSVLYVAAHPDDENTALLAYLAQGMLVRAAYLSITRGDGGQNLIGTELAEQLGVIRTQELLEARHRDGAEQWFTRAIDFGYTKSVDETLEVWGHEAVLGDVVRVVRRFQPDVIIMRFPGDGRGRHGQHTASAVLAAEAFEAAADPARFVEHFEGPEKLAPWQAKRLLWDQSRFFGGSQASDGITVDLGSYSPVLGRSFTEIAATSRSMHKSQGFGSEGRRGTTVSTLEHRLGDESKDDLFEGVDTSWARIGGGEDIGTVIEQALDEFDPNEPSGIVPLLLEADERLTALRARSGTKSAWLEFKQGALREVIRGAMGLWLEVTTDRASASAGGSVTLTATAVNRSPVEVEVLGVELPFAETVEVGETLAFNEPWVSETEVRVPAGALTTEPYWLREPGTFGRFAVSDPQQIGWPEWLSNVARFDLLVAKRPLSFDVPLLYRWSDRVEGELYRTFDVVPPVSVRIEDAVLVFGDGQPRSVSVVVGTIGEAARGDVRLQVPSGWMVTPESAPFALEPGTEARLEFQVEPPEGSSIGEMTAVAALAEGSGRGYSAEVLRIEHRHIPVQTLLPLADARLVRMQLARRGQRIGYVMGAGDEVPDALRQVGYEVTLLSDDDLASGDLGIYDAIAVGVRAYNARPATRQYNQRLLDYVKAGGTLVVQYNTASRRGGGPSGIGPFPFRVSRDRVSVEDAPVELLDPDHPVLSSPNRITQDDFEGWVQERGLYFPDEWDERYQPLLASHDPGEPDRTGGLLVAEHGKGIYIYTGYSFFRELPAGVPGAYRLFVNLISARQFPDD